MNNTKDIIQEQSRCIAHEIRNHISICELYNQIIKKNLEKNNIKNESIDNAVNCIETSLKIMSNSLIDLKSLGNFSPRVYDIKNILEEAINLSVVYVNEKNIQINTNITHSENVFIDENKFLACVVNIIKNAIEAIDKKGEIFVSSEVVNNFIRIKIANTGTRIPEEKQKQIFEEGFTTKQTGSGLGLHICSDNLKKQNAELKLIKSTKDITEFEIILPIYKY